MPRLRRPAIAAARRGLLVALAAAALYGPLAVLLEGLLGPAPFVLDLERPHDERIVDEQLVVRAGARATVRATLGRDDQLYVVGSADRLGPFRMLRLTHHPDIPDGWFAFALGGRAVPRRGPPLEEVVHIEEDDDVRHVVFRTDVVRHALGDPARMAIMTFGHRGDLEVDGARRWLRATTAATVAAFFVTGWVERRRRFGSASAILSTGRFWLAFPSWALIALLLLPGLVLPIRPVAVLAATGALWAFCFLRPPLPVGVRQLAGGLAALVLLLSILAIAGFLLQRELRAPEVDAEIVARAAAIADAPPARSGSAPLLVLVIGSSSTEAESFSREFRSSRAWAALLVEELEARLLGREVRVVNLAKGATTTVYGLRVLSEVLGRVRPDWVVVDYVHNDWVLEFLQGPPSRWLARLGIDLEPPSRRYRDNLRAIVSRTHAAGGRTLFVLEPTFSSFLGRERESAVERDRAPAVPRHGAGALGPRPYEAREHVGRGHARADTSGEGEATEGDGDGRGDEQGRDEQGRDDEREPDDGERPDQLDSFYRIMREVGAATGTPVIDGNDPFVRRRSKIVHPFHDDGVHFNAWGHRVMARFVATALARLTTEAAPARSPTTPPGTSLDTDAATTGEEPARAAADPAAG